MARLRRARNWQWIPSAAHACLFARSWTMMARPAPSGKVDSSVPLRVKIAGKAEDGAQSLVVLRFQKREGTIDKSVLVNRFSLEWREVSQEVTVPEGALSLQNVFLYRFKTKGRVWYGPVKIERADARPEGTDVSDRVRGAFPSLSRSAFRMFQYTDDNPPSVSPRVRVQLVLREA